MVTQSRVLHGSPKLTKQRQPTIQRAKDNSSLYLYADDTQIYKCFDYDIIMQLCIQLTINTGNIQ